MTQAVVFDLWRTLVPLAASHRRAALDGTAKALDSDTSEFRQAWAATRVARETGDLRCYFDELGTLLGREWDGDQITVAMRARRQAHYAAFSTLRAGARQTLSRLREDGFLLALTSNCSSDVRWMLRDSDLEPAFDEVILSAEVGVMKPDPAIYRCALDRLGATTALYVGDGDDNELVGARKAGLTDVLLDLGEGRDATLVVHGLEEVPPLVRGMRR